MESIWLWAAGLVTSVGVFVHVVLGGKMFVRPFLANDIPNEHKWMAYLVWHVASVAFVFMTVGFIAAATLPGRADYAVIATAFAGFLVVTALMVCWKSGLSPRNFPAIPLFSVVTTLGLIGLLT